MLRLVLTMDHTDAHSASAITGVSTSSCAR